ncbi:MAG: hypothetical protein ABIP79_09865 [Chitinophagaceae bacterium]
MKKILSFLYQYPFFLFLLFLVVAYLPVLLPYFHLKNDLITQNLPTRYVFSEGLNSGFEPFWNPYLHYGSPQYGDMNNGFWNPLQWFIGSTFGYNIYTITFEELFYILIGSWGIYKVAREFFSKDVAIITGLTYMCCGYLTGHLQYLCWITGTGYFPFVLLYFIRINKNPIIKNFLLGGISVFLFVAATHPGLIIGAAYFFVFALLVIYFNRKGLLKELYHRNFWFINFSFLLISAILSLVVIYSNIEVLTYISRGTKVSLDETLMTPTSLQSYLSIYLPLPVHKTNFFQTDIAMRNIYIGIAHLLGLLYIIKISSRKTLVTFGIPLLFFILLSAGSYFKMFAWKFLPFLGFVRLNGEFAYFVVLLFLLFGGAGIHLLLQKKINWPSKASFHLLLLTLVATALSLLLLFITKSSILFSSSSNFSSLKEIIKSLIDNTSIWDLLLAQSIIQIVTLWFFRKDIDKKSTTGFVLCINLILITWITLPFTGLGMMSKKEVQTIIEQFPKGIQPQELVSINNANYITPPDESQFLLIASYSKKIGSKMPDQYPVQLWTNSAFIGDKDLYNFIKNQSYIFLSDDTTINTRTNFDSSNIKVQRAGPGLVKCIVSNADFQWLTLLQNNYKYWEVKVDSKLVTHYTGFKTFISIPLEKGQHEIVFRFNANPIKRFALINIFLILTAISFAIYPKSGKKKLFK